MSMLALPIAVALGCGLLWVMRSTFVEARAAGKRRRR